LGAKKIVFGSAAARNVTSDFSMEKAHKQIIERLSFIATVAEKNHVQIEIEHLKPVLKRIFECKYNGTFSIEAYFPGFTMDYAQSVSEIKKILNGISQ
jgi:hypothetical protein